MKLNWVDLTDYTQIPERRDPEGKVTKPRPNVWTAHAGPLLLTITTIDPKFPNEWSLVLEPLLPFPQRLMLPERAEDDIAQERAVYITRNVLEACLAKLPR